MLAVSNTVEASSKYDKVSQSACAGSAAQLAAVAAAPDLEKENLAEGASAMVTAALQLQPLLARARRLRGKERSSAVKDADGMNRQSCSSPGKPSLCRSHILSF